MMISSKICESKYA